MLLHVILRDGGDGSCIGMNGVYDRVLVNQLRAVLDIPYFKN